jgi:cytochrome b6-f complex iron-sulfur subunit
LNHIHFVQLIKMALALGNKVLSKPAARPAVARRPATVVVRAAAAAASEVPDMNKRNIMNLILLGGVGVPATGMLGAYAYFFVPKS